MQLEEIIDCKYKVYAHLSEGENKKPAETLQQHICLCEYYAENLLNVKNLNKPFEYFLQKYIGTEESDEGKKSYESIRQISFDMLNGMIFFHDIGKINPIFQKETMKNTNYPFSAISSLSGSKHSFFSAIIYLDYYYNRIAQSKLKKPETRKLKILAYIMAFVISRHHSNLDTMENFITEFNEGGRAYELIKELSECSFPVYKGPFFFHVNNIEFVTNRENEICKLSRTLKIDINIMIRFLYSFLVSVDYYATSEYMTGYQVKYFGDIEEKNLLSVKYESSPLLTKIREYESKIYRKKEVEDIHTINELRSELFLDVEQAWKENKEQSIFFLEAPTGSGKTNIAMNLSFQMIKEGQSKIIYIYPFNTLVEQTVETLRNTFGEWEDIVSKITVINSVTPIKIQKVKEEQEETLYYQKALLDRQFLNYPFIISTHVSLFEILFGDSRESVFGFLQLAGSVIVLDEIQSYKNRIWSEIILFLEEAADLLGIKIIIMSATLPDLTYLTEEKNQVIRLVKDRKKYFNHPIFRERVQISYELLDKKIELEDLIQHIEKNTTEEQGILIEFIKKATAYQFYSLLCEREIVKRKIFLLTGDDNIIDRSKVLHEIKKDKKGSILVATQVVEAGIDIDMDVGYKDSSKLDSEEQFLGRINRSCKQKSSKGVTYFFNLDNAEKIYMGDIRRNVEFTLKNNSMRDILDNKNFEDYYKPVLEVLKNQINALSNEEGLEYLFDSVFAKGNFRKIASRMKLIEEKDWTLSVYLSRCIILEDGSELDGWKCWNEYKELLKNQQMSYAEKQVRLSQIRQELNYFIYEIKRNSNLVYSDRIGELYAIQCGEEYFVNGKLDKEKLEKAGGMFIEL